MKCGTMEHADAWAAPTRRTRLLADLARRSPLLPGKDTIAFLDISMQKRVYGRKKLGAAFGHTKIQGESLLVQG
jgi:hypothetical protein